MTTDVNEVGGDIEYDPGTDTFSTIHDWGDDTPISTVIVRLVAELEDVGPTDLDPLHDFVDPDALDRLVAPKRDGTPRTGAHVSFRFEGYHVTVRGDGEVVLSSLQ
jgi:hypothetical protein